MQAPCLDFGVWRHRAQQEGVGTRHVEDDFAALALFVGDDGMDGAEELAGDVGENSGTT